VCTVGNVTVREYKTNTLLWKQIDFTLIRIAADLAVNFFTTGWYVFACRCMCLCVQALAAYVTALSDSVSSPGSV
jgi:hypothetical protein